jgi:hypothetical protein
MRDNKFAIGSFLSSVLSPSNPSRIGYRPAGDDAPLSAFEEQRGCFTGKSGQIFTEVISETHPKSSA